MIHDQAVEQIRERRRRILRERYAGSIDRWMDGAQKWQREHPDRVVTLEDVRRIRKAS
jgi:hypothetical protein